MVDPTRLLRKKIALACVTIFLSLICVAYERRVYSWSDDTFLQKGAVEALHRNGNICSPDQALNIIDGKLYPLPSALATFNRIQSRRPAKFGSTAQPSLYEVNDLVVPFEFDCERWGDHPYHTAVPSRFIECARQSFLVSAGLPCVPQYWVIDEEIFEFNAILEALLEFQRQHETSIARNFVIFELGARWGTWGARTLAAAQVLGVTAYAAYWEPVKMHCEGLNRVHELNRFSKDSFSLQCGLADEQSVAEKMMEHEHIDVLDVDIQGAEGQLLPLLKAEIDRRVHYLIVGTHGQNIHNQMLRLFRDWLNLRDIPMDNARIECIKEELRGRRNYSALFQKNCYVHTNLGPIANWDGELIFKNPSFAT